MVRSGRPNGAKGLTLNTCAVGESMHSSARAREQERFEATQAQKCTRSESEIFGER